MPITIPAGVTVKVAADNTVSVKGPKGELTEKIVPSIIVSMDAGILTVERKSDAKQERSYHGLSRALINNMVKGVTEGFQKTLQIEGVGYRALKSGKKLTLNMGYSHPVEFDEEPNITFDVPTPNQIIVKGISKQRVGELAANIRQVRPPEPYLGKGIKYEGERIIRKEGKAGKK